ncbi:MAG: MBL fold metallo-hydrolase [Armatimonadota bacterium]|nr:MBL fold metallo-hydrolase [Armatimonadota bacterium]MDR7485447.1 MBL fold metallo-hydrolase [Armatimonadota bacterium]MDR7534370.1 MBL fold metallo-hydrolase [Armatimonadota bacterium]MDR7536835.1 MBL fold metallo-hydrolase [Armatimonadota bacterium]
MILETLQVGPVGTNAYVIGDEATHAGAIIDPGDEPARVLAVVARHQLTVEAIVATHAHFDHVGAVRPLVEATGAPFLLHEAELPVLEVAAERALLLFGVSVPPPPPPTRLLREGETLTLAGRPFRVVHAPGHSPGHLCLLGEGLAFVGDVIFRGSIGRTDLPGGDYEVLLRSIARHILTLPDDTVLYNGHGPATTVEWERRTNPFLAGLSPAADA